MRKSSTGFLLPVFIFILACLSTGFAQGHQHGTASPGDGNFNPSLITDNRGGFYLAYITRKNGASNVMLRHSPDGKTFSPSVPVNDVDGDAAARNENPPKVVVAGNGNLYSGWANERERWKGNIRFTRSTDGGKTFSFNRKILSDVCECCRANLQIDSAGRLYLSYRTVPSSGPRYRDIIVARSENGGKSFQQTVVSHDQWDINACAVAGPTLSIDNNDRVYVVWFTGSGDRPALYYATSANRGRSYSPRALLDPNQSFGKHAQVAPLSDGKVLVAWEGQTEQSVIFWGVLDAHKGLLHKSPARQQVTYPTITTNTNTVVLAG